MLKGEIIYSILEGLNISNNRYVFIMSYIKRMIIDYKGRPFDIIKEIPLNLKGNERYFAIFYTSLTFGVIYFKMNEKQKTEFITKLTKSLKLSSKSIAITSEYITHFIDKQIKENIAPIDIIKNIINSKFSDIEKDYVIFIFGLAGWILKNTERR